jgi:rhodanese-related sulfurtransferase
VKNGIPQLTVKELKRRIDAGEDVYILDVREPYEYKIAQIGGKLIPQNEVPNRSGEIDRDREVIVQCHSGIRSQRIAEFLKQPAIRRSSTSPAASWPGPTRSTPRCRSTDVVGDHLGLPLLGQLQQLQVHLADGGKVVGDDLHLDGGVGLHTLEHIEAAAASLPL